MRWLHIQFLPWLIPTELTGAKSEENNHPEIARREAEKALALRGGLFHNRVLVAMQSEVLAPIQL